MLVKYDLKMPHAVFSGEDALDKIRDIIAENHVKHLAVFTDKGIRGAGLLDLPMARVEETGVDTVILDDLPAEPSYEEAQKLVDQCKACGADFIMAVGGGSVMDTAKLASILMTDEYGVKELLDTPTRAKKCIKTLMIPTTAGTGSEATPNAIVAVPEKQLKVGIVNTEMIADYVILDAVMIKKLPRKIAAATGVDALAHAIECWTSNKANPFSDIFAMQALDMILNNIEKACDDPDAMDARTRCRSPASTPAWPSPLPAPPPSTPSAILWAASTTLPTVCPTPFCWRRSCVSTSPPAVSAWPLLTTAASAAARPPWRARAPRLSPVWRRSSSI